MKTRLLYLLALLLGTTFVHGQAKQGFESETFPPENWTVYHLLGVSYNSNGWTRQLQSKPASVEETNHVAYSLNGYYMDNTDSWLITPKTLVKPGDHLNFMLKIANASYSTTDTLDILVSESGKEKANFTSRLLRIIPKNGLEWSQYCIDLSEYANKEVYIAFHDHLMNPESYVVGCKIYLDDVVISGDTSSDLSVASVVSPRSECSTIQYVDLAINNAGKAVDKFTVCYQLNESEIKKENFSRTIEANSQINVTFESPVEFAADSKNSFKAWVECEKDNNPANNSLTVDINIDSQIPFPYNMSDRTTVDSDFLSYAITSQWMCMDVGLMPGMSWMYVGRPEGGYLGSKCIDLPKGKVRISFSYFAAQHSILKVSAAPIAGFNNYKEIVGESQILLGNGQVGTASFVADIPREGIQSLGFLVFSPSSPNENMQLILNGICIEKLNEDIAIDELVEPFGTSLAKSDVEKEVVIKISNEGVSEQTNFKVFYQLNNGEITSEVYEKVLKSGESENYSFARKIKLDQKGQHHLKIWLESELDINSKNDTIKKDLYIYEPCAMPYRMSFESEDDVKDWTFVNANRDAVEWKLADLSFKGSKVAYLSFVENMSNDDYLISPAVYLPAGKARISFFYMLNNAGTAKIEVLMGKSTKPEEFEKTLITSEENTNGWNSGYALIETDVPGYYHFAVRGTGINGEIVLDDIRVDTEVDACMKEVVYVEKGNYNLTTSPIKIIFSNHSAKSINQAKVSYQLNGKTIVSETINKEMKPGEQIEHTFKQPVDISMIGTHSVRGWVEVKDDSEEYNNSMTMLHEHYRNKEIPYFQDFEDATARHKWNASIMDLNKDGNTWIPAGNAMYSAYSGNTCLYFESNSGGNDWIFSECIEIPAGDFEFSFFYRTYKNLSDRKENFKIMLGTSPNPESMTIEVANYRETSVADPLEHMKVISRLKMDKEGKYYIGVYTDSPASQGMIVIDDISIKKYEEKIPFYMSDFTDRFDEWTPYRIYPGTFDQWTKTTEEGKAYDIVQLKTFKISNTPGIFVSPGFKMEKGKPIDFEMEYSLLSPDAGSKLGLYMGSQNHPDSITTLIEEFSPSKEWELFYKEITVDKTGRYFFAIKAQRTSQEHGSYYKLGYLKLTPARVKTYELKGKLTDAAGNAIEGASVNLVGGQSQQTTTGKDGKFEFSMVLDMQNYTLKIAKDKFIAYSNDLKMEGVTKDLGNIILKYEVLKPIDVKAQVNNNTTVQVSWSVPGKVTEYRYDDGIPFGQVGFNSGTSADVMGTVFRSSAKVSEVSWFTTTASGIHEKINVFILALDREGNPTNTILYEHADTPNKDMQWCSHQLTEPVNAPNGFMVGVSYNSGSLGLAIDDGIEDYPFSNNTCYIGNILAGEFNTFENQGGKSSFLLRAKGISMDASVNKVAKDENAESSLLYNVYRFKKSDKTTESKWALLTQKPITQTAYTDEVSTLNGEYIYAVKTTYPSKEESEAVFSDVVNIKNKNTIETNSDSGKLRIWPLPAKDYLNISSDVVVNKYVIYDLIGTVVSSQQVDEKEFVIPTDGLATGHYLISLYTEDGKIDRKVIKQ